MDKPNRTLRQSKASTPAQVRCQKDKVAEQKTQQAKADAMKDAGIKPQQQQPPAQSKQKPPAKPARKPSNRKPPKR